MKKFLVISFIAPFVLVNACGQNNTIKVHIPEKSRIDSQYSELVSFDTLHIHPINFPNSIAWENARIITNEETRSYGLDSGNYRALQRFYFDKNKTIIGYLLGEKKSENHITIHLVVYDVSLNKQIFKLEAASYNYLEGAMQKTRNSWITDLNNDGVMDIATREFLEDFEFSTEDVPNTTGEASFIHVFHDGKFEYDYWKENILPGTRLIK